MKNIATMTDAERNDEIAARIAALLIREGKQKSTARAAQGMQPVWRRPCSGLQDRIDWTHWA